jgi:hypothetical protein
MCDSDPAPDPGTLTRCYSVECAEPLCDKTRHIAARSKKEAGAILWESDWSRYKRLGWTCPRHDAEYLRRLNRDRRLIQGD